MQARLKTSNKWSPLPKELTEQVVKVFSDNFLDESDRGNFVAEGRIFPQEILLRVGYRKDKELRQTNVEISAEYGQGEDEVLKKIYLCIDAAGSLFSEYFDHLHQLSDDMDQKSDYAESPQNLEADNEQIYGFGFDGNEEENPSDDNENDVSFDPHTHSKTVRTDANGIPHLPFLWKPMEFMGQTLYVQSSSANTDLEADADRILGQDKSGLFNEDDSLSQSPSTEDDFTSNWDADDSNEAPDKKRFH